ncbi:uncharacterized protein BYT42DRAFT_595278 [Radiomyces spectabilis]|uniref:uncharacterized protein n=1 Tax=Radiomyces spectabilis TaxID=64574 RepID=UPI002220C00E|nr:uncharacterized protein BYT42DRAFT_595278 [Radiomyces spectabilis]KAI8370553.1 hypothetical protein BYT42DRAFT_595278 [Radiomyces spectabilis]
MVLIKNIDDIRNKSFDYIIVGGGTAGCVLANRLSAQKHIEVLLLEAGTEVAQELEASRIPGLSGRLRKSENEWCLRTTTQDKINDRSLDVPLGKMLGGSSAMNATVLHRCSPSDYDAWQIKGWTYDDLQPYFEKAEKYHASSASKVNGHGTNGPMHTSDVEVGPLGVPFRNACASLGLNFYEDMTLMRTQIGVTNVHAMIHRGQRSSTSASYMTAEVLERLNLTVALGCQVQKIVIEKQRATHVRFTLKGSQENLLVSARREIIVCGGAIHSPHLLMLSGLGCARQLADHGIEAIRDLPGVGANLQNHWRVPFVHETTNPKQSLHGGLFRDPHSLVDAQNGKGALTRAWPDAVAYFNIPDCPSNSSHAADAPQFELFTGGIALCDLLPQLHDVDCATLLLVLLAPFSRGSVKLGPIVDPGLLQDERDVECFHKGLQYVLQIANDDAYKPNIKRWILAPTDDQSPHEYIRQHIDSIHHYAGTCKMGHSDDPMAVVDAQLKVIGIEALRVVDASIFPQVPAGQICFPVIACAEKAADVILNNVY